LQYLKTYIIYSIQNNNNERLERMRFDTGD